MQPSSDFSIALDEFRGQRLLFLVDDLAASPRGVLVSPCQEINSDTVNRLLTISSGILFAALSPERAQGFMLEPMLRPQTSQATQTGSVMRVCVSVEAREGVSTGISAADRARTLAVLGASEVQARQLVRPGHIFPVIASAGGALIKHALPEGALDIVQLAGFNDAAAYADLLNPEGELQSQAEIQALAKEHKLPLLFLSQVVRQRLEHERLVSRVASAKLPTLLAGEVQAYIYRSQLHDGEHVALVKGSIDPQQTTLVRVQPEQTFSDVFGGSLPSSRLLLQLALREIARHGSGVLMYLRRPSRGLLRSQVDGAAQRPGALMREYGLGAQILRDLGVRRIELLSSSGKHDLGGLDTFDLEIVAHRAMDLSAAALAEAQAALDAERTKQCTTQHCIVPPVTKGDSEA